MIQIYSPSNTNYEMNGDAVLLPLSCLLDAKLGGAWEMVMIHPHDAEERWKYIEENAVLSVPTFMGKNQLFRIYEVEKTDDDVEAHARPIFFDAMTDTFIMDTRPTDCNGQAALDWLMAGTPYSGESDITTVNTAYYVRKNLIEALQGSDENSFINRWGGEPLYSNFTVYLNERAGRDANVAVVYGKNIKSIAETVNTEEIITRIIPIAFNGHMLAGDRPWVDSPYISSYPHIYAKLVKFETYKLRADVTGEPAATDHIYETIEDLRLALRTAAEQMFYDGCDRPKVTLNIDMVDLSRTVEYADYAVLESVSLGDTVHCRHSKLDIETDARVVSLKWDCVNDCIETVTLGDTKYDYFRELNKVYTAAGDVIDAHGNVVADRVRGTLDLLNTRLKLQQDIADHQTVRAIMFEDLDPESPTYGAMCIGTQGLEISTTRNAQDTDWIWGTAIDSQTVHADHIISGLLADKAGNNYWNLDTGAFRLASSSTTVDGQSLANYVDNAASQSHSLSMNLTNEYMGIRVNASSVPIYTVETTATVFYGTQDVTSQCEFAVTTTVGVTGTWNTTTKTYTVTKMEAANGSVYIEATYLGVLVVRKTFVIATVTQGANGRAYILDASDSVIRVLDVNGTLAKDYVDFNAYYFDGNSTSETPYLGRFLIEATPDGASYETVYESSFNESAVHYLLGAVLIDDDEARIVHEDENEEQFLVLTAPIDTKELRCTLYAADGFETVIGRKTVVFLRDAGALSQQEAFDILTNNGETMGIYKEGNHLFINADFIGTGVIMSPRNPQNYWNMDTGEFSLSSSAKINGSSSNTIGSMSSQITANAEAITMRVTSAQAKSIADTEIAAKADSIRLKTGTLTWTANNSTLTQDGTLTATNANITGTVKAGSGEIAGLAIDGSAIHTKGIAVTSNAKNSAALSSADFTRTIGGASRSGLRLAVGSGFGVSNTGVLYASDAVINGAITATSLTLSGSATVPAAKVTGTMTAAHIKGGTLTLGGADNVDGQLVVKDANGTSIGTWNKDGITATKGTFTGTVRANTGYIGTSNGFTIASGKLYTGSHSAYNSSGAGVYVGTDYIALGSGGKIWLKNDGTARLGSWNVNGDNIYHSKSSMTGETDGIFFGKDGIGIGKNFTVTKSGSMTAKSGFIGKYTITGNELYTGTGDRRTGIGGARAFWAGAEKSAEAPFRVDYDGDLVATNANITGKITATDLTLTGSAKIPAAKISDTLKASQIDSNAIEARHINAKAVTASKIDTGAITADKISTGAITATKIKDGEVSTVKIASGAITVSKINDGAVSNAKLASGAVTTTKITDSAITTEKIKAGAITADKIEAGAITADKVAANAITSSKINVGSLSAISSNLGSIMGGSLNIGNGTFKVTSSGALTATSATISGTITGGTKGSSGGYWVQLSPNGKLEGGNKSTKYPAYIDFTGSAKFDDGKTHYGIQIQGDYMRMSLRTLDVSATSDISHKTYSGVTKEYIVSKPDGGVEFLNFVNGICIGSASYKK